MPGDSLRAVPPDADLHRLRIRVDGIVQGVGFRPYVHGLATSLRLAGLVGNDAAGVFIEVEGAREAVTRFISGLERDHPPLAVIERIDARPVPVTGERGFVIAASDPAGEPRALVSADTATCGDCLRELLDPADRRYRYPFINCTNCGPRFTIIRGVPYDRPLTTMAGFTMCPDCSREYHDPRDRRFHAQPTCCPACGPSLRLTTSEARVVADAGGSGPSGPGVSPGDAVSPRASTDPIGSAARLLREGLVVAVKGLGGYHLAVLAACEPAAAALRSRKHREHKPFAIMVADVAAGHDLCEIDPAEERVLASPRRPIVLLRRCPGAQVAPSVAPGSRFLGLMLPYTPLHHLLARELAAPFVLTSGNIGDEPIAFDDADARDRLAGIADAFLAHDRPIHMRTDDSVTRVVGGRPAVLRRSRGFVPEPLVLAEALRRPVLACGAELKNTFCVAKGRHAFVSHHIGDLENFPTMRSFRSGITHFTRLFGIRPEVVAHDLHPEYLSTKYALDLAGEGCPGAELVGVQHHHAHVAACLADNRAAGPVIGVAFDGLGFGTDGTLWGGEFLVADLVSFQRAGHLQPVRMPGGAAAIREPWRMAAAYLDAAFDGEPPSWLAVTRAHGQLWQPVVAVARAGINSPLTSSAGRLFDAISAMLGWDRVSYEGQAAVELEQLADPAERSAYQGVFDNAEPFSLLGTCFVRDVADDLRAGTPPPVIAARFHNGLADAVVTGCERIRDSSGLSNVALSGGVFQNMLLTERVRAGLAERGFGVLLHSRVPPNDGGISLGQAVVAGARDAVRAR